MTDVDIVEKAIVDLVFKAGWTSKEAFSCLGRKYSGKSTERFFEKESVKKYIEASGLDPDDTSMIDMMNSVDGVSKEDQIKRYRIIMKNCPPGSKGWFEASKRIDDILQLKKEESSNQKELIHYYLPLNCSNCKLYIKAREEAIAAAKAKKEENSKK